MKFLLLVLLMSGCAMVSVHTKYGKAIETDTEESVLEVLSDHPDSDIYITGESGKYMVFITKKDVPVDNILLSSTELESLQILIEQHTKKGWRLQGGIAVSSTLGTLSYFATMVK